MILGTVLALGITLLYPLAIGITLLYLLLAHKRLSGTPRIPFSLWIVTLIVGMSVLSTDSLELSGKPILWCVNALSAYLTARYLTYNHLTQWPILIIVFCAIGISIYEYSAGVIRVRGLSENASIMGIAGVSLFSSYYGAALSGISISRTSLAVWLLLAISNPIRKALLAAGIVLALNVGITLMVAPERLSIDTIMRDNNIRTTAITGTTSEHAPSTVTNPPPVKGRVWSWRGYGYGNYVNATGLIQPHNVFVRSWWELGIFALPFWGYLIHLWWQLPGTRNYYLPLAILSAGMFTDEFYGSMEGTWILLALWYGTKALPHPFTWLLKFGRIGTSRLASG